MHAQVVHARAHLHRLTQRAPASTRQQDSLSALPSAHILLVDDQERASSLRLQHDRHELGVDGTHITLEWRLGDLYIIVTELGLVGRPEHVAELGVAHPADRHAAFALSSTLALADETTGQAANQAMTLLGAKRKGGGAFEHVTM